MKQEHNSTASAKQRGLYYGLLSLLAVITVGAIAATFLAGGEEQEPVNPMQQLQAEESKKEEDSTAKPAEDSKSQAVSKDPVQPNSEIQEVKAPETESSSENESKAATVQAEPEKEINAEFDAETETMVWPVSGNVVMEYSADTLIYDKTLDQYRVNDSISISAVTGEAVVAAAQGIVKSIGCNDILGNYVVISHGNGLETTYGQLQEAVDVSVDQVVSKGETIGYIAEPSWYGTALGSHVEFQVTQDGVAVDPTIYLEGTLDE